MHTPSNEKKLILSIDQGGTKTDVLIADQFGNLIGFGDDRDWKQQNGERRALRMTRLKYAADKALTNAGVALSDISCVSAGLIGADWDFEYTLAKKNVHKTLGIKEVAVFNDCISAMRGGTEINNRDCAILCLGSGANCAIKNRDGKEFIYAYYMKMEHQGAYALGNFVFQAAYDAEAGLGEKTVLTELLLEQTGHLNIEELFMHTTTGRTENEPVWHPEYKKYGPLVFKAIRMGDKVAHDYLDWFCDRLVHYIVVGAERLHMRERNIMVVLSGGVPKGGAVMRDMLEKHLHTQLTNAVCVEARLEPVVGALLLEYDQIYPEGIPSNIWDTLEKCCYERNLFRTIAP